MWQPALALQCSRFTHACRKDTVEQAVGRRVAHGVEGRPVQPSITESLVHVAVLRGHLQPQLRGSLVECRHLRGDRLFLLLPRRGNASVKRSPFSTAVLWLPNGLLDIRIILNDGLKMLEPVKATHSHMNFEVGTVGGGAIEPNGGIVSLEKHAVTRVSQPDETHLAKVLGKLLGCCPLAVALMVKSSV
jgi:hypothetical protein